VTVTSPNAQPLLEVDDLKKSFEKEGRTIHVLSGVSLRLRAGESVSIMGRSGAGKTTLLQILGTLDRPTSGTLRFGGRDVFAGSDATLSKFRGEEIGFVFQFHHLLPEFTTLENAAMPAIIGRVPRREALSRAEALLERVGLAHRLTHRPGELSGGEQQRVALARAMVMRPSLLLADEPTGNLDEETGGRVFELFREMTEELGAAVVVVTHNSQLAAAMDRRMEMVDGRLVDGASGAAA
jgi:lipoprotein-releasing system ATP-binding protein